MLQEYRNSKKQGDAGMGIAIGWFCQQGYTVSIPITDSQDYDLVVENEEGLQKVQVKTTRTERREIDLMVRGGNKTGHTRKAATEIVYDLLFAVTGDGTMYLIPKTKFGANTRALILGKKYEGYKV